jgi:hypothetical protein
MASTIASRVASSGSSRVPRWVIARGAQARRARKGWRGSSRSTFIKWSPTYCQISMTRPRLKT